MYLNAKAVHHISLYFHEIEMGTTICLFLAPKTKLKSKDPLCIYFPLILSSTTLPPQNGHKNAKSHWYGWLVLPTVAILDRFDNFF